MYGNIYVVWMDRYTKLDLRFFNWIGKQRLKDVLEDSTIYVVCRAVFEYCKERGIRGQRFISRDVGRELMHLVSTSSPHEDLQLAHKINGILTRRLTLSSQVTELW